MSDKTLVLGIGSPFADDQFGWFVADKVEQLTSDRSDIVVDSADRPGMNLLSYLNEGYSKIFLIDAVYAKQKPGTFYHLNADKIIGFDGFLSSHSIGVSPSLALAQALKIDISNVEFIGVEMERMNEKDSVLSVVVRNAIPVAAKKIMKLVF
jgi:hydrogenase maturation protease